MCVYGGVLLSGGRGWGGAREMAASGDGGAAVACCNRRGALCVYAACTVCVYVICMLVWTARIRQGGRGRYMKERERLLGFKFVVIVMLMMKKWQL